jgi:hypothetical protein
LMSEPPSSDSDSQVMLLKGGTLRYLQHMRCGNRRQTMARHNATCQPTLAAIMGPYMMILSRTLGLRCKGRLVAHGGCEQAAGSLVRVAEQVSVRVHQAAHTRNTGSGSRSSQGQVRVAWHGPTPAPPVGDKAGTHQML